MAENENDEINVNYNQEDIDQLSPNTSGMITIDLNQGVISTLTEEALSDLIDIISASLSFKMDFRFIVEKGSIDGKLSTYAQLCNDQIVKDSFKSILKQVLDEIDSKDFYEAWPIYNNEDIIGKVVISDSLGNTTPTQYSIFTNQSSNDVNTFVPSGEYCKCCGRYINTPNGESAFSTLNPSVDTSYDSLSGPYCYDCHYATCNAHAIDFNALSGNLYVIKDSDESIFYYCENHKGLSGNNSTLLSSIQQQFEDQTVTTV